MIVCEVSGNFMNSTDNGERLRCHFEGKQYQGWKLIRDKLKELKKQNPPPKGQSRYGAFGRSTHTTTCAPHRLYPPLTPQRYTLPPPHGMPGWLGERAHIINVDSRTLPYRPRSFRP